MKIWILLLFLLKRYSTSGPDIVVPIEHGLIRGTTFISSRSNQSFYGFIGIPYAQPPVGNLRFKEPHEKSSWSGIRNTTAEGNNCPQFSMFEKLFENYIGDEDCLYMNVYTPELPAGNEEAKLPVMVWIHGGEFLCGSGDRDMYGPDYLVDEGVVLVTFNYRLGVLGFLSLQNYELPGNNGLKDQVFALKWVKRNIKMFGGNPNKVTIFGESAGGASVHYHLLSPLSQGLFVSAISQSGSALNPWAYQTPESSLKFAFDLAEKYGPRTSDPQKILKLLMKANPRDFVEFTNKQLYAIRIGGLIGPTLDTKADSENVFLPDLPINIMNSGNFTRVPYITGMNSEEAILIARLLKSIKLLLQPVTFIFRFSLPYYIGESIPHVSQMAAEVKDKYFSNSRPIVLQYIDVLTDMIFGNTIYCTAQKHSENSTLYAYEFSFNGTANVVKRACDGTEFPGAAHADDLAYLFKLNAFKVKIKPKTPEYFTSRRMVRLWTNFAKTGNPTPIPDPVLQNVTWYPVMESNFPYLNIGTNLSIKEELNNGHGQWWQELYKNYTEGVTPCWTNH